MNIFGGETPHVGTVVLAISRPSLRHPKETSATSSVLTLVGHKDDIVARSAAELMAKVLGVPAVVIAGVHVEGATDDDIYRLTLNSEEVVRKLLVLMGRMMPLD